MNFVSLPNELIVRVASNLNLQDLLEFSHVNRLSFEVCGEYSLWVGHLKHFKRSKACNTSDELTPEYFETLADLKLFCVKVINKWDWLVGLWQSEIPDFGGLLQVKLEVNPCRVVGYDIEGLDDLTKSARQMFSISCEEYSNPSSKCNDIICCEFFSTVDHGCTIARCGPKRIVLHCDSAAVHDESEMGTALMETRSHNSLAIAGSYMRELSGDGLGFGRIKSPLSATRINPGVFAGNYGTHGTELLYLHQVENCFVLRKISGDQNVPAGIVSIIAETLLEVDYTAFLTSLVEDAGSTDEFNLKESIEKHLFDPANVADHKSSDTETKRLSVLTKSLDRLFPGQGWNFAEGHSFVEAFKGEVTLRMIGGAYFENEVLVVVVDSDKVFVLWQYNNSPSNLGECMTMKFKRLEGV